MKKGEGGSDYINANFLDGNKLKNSYIATQVILVASTLASGVHLKKGSSLLILAVCDHTRQFDFVVRHYESTMTSRYGSVLLYRVNLNRKLAKPAENVRELIKPQ